MKKRTFVYVFIFSICLFHLLIPHVVFGQHAQQVFDRYPKTFHNLDVQMFFPEVLRGFKRTEIQSALRSSEDIEDFRKFPKNIGVVYPGVDNSIIALLTIDEEFRTLFKDKDFHTVLQNSTKIDKLAWLIERPIPTKLEIVSGNNQHNLSGELLPEPFVVKVLDQKTQPLIDRTMVTFKILRDKGGRGLPEGPIETNELGQAQTTFRLGSDPGIYQVEASVIDYPSLTQTFTAAATGSGGTHSKPTELSIVSRKHQSGEVGKPLAQPFVVGVLDQAGKPLQGVVVTFATAGGGQLSVHRIPTDVYGQAQTTLTLGSRAGHHSVVARAVGITQTQTFTATAIPRDDDDDDDDEGSSTEEPPMYWIAGNRIYYRPTGGRKTVFNALQSETLTGGLAVDMKGEKVYWTEEMSDNMGRIQSADLDGRNVETVQETIAVPYDIAFDAEENNLYWTNSLYGMPSRGKIQSFNVDDKEFRGDFITPEKFPTMEKPMHIAFDVEKRRLHWTAANGIWSIYTDNDTGIPRRLSNGDLGELGGIAVFDDVVYWTEQTNGSGKVRSMNRTGKDDKLLAVPESVPEGIAVDSVGRKVYWTTSRGEIQSVPLTGAIQTVVMHEAGTGPAAGIALGGTVDTVGVPAGPAAPSVSSVGSVQDTLLANYPNPFNPETWIPYQLSASADVSVSIYAVDGTLVRRLDLGHQSAGVYRSRSRAAYWDGRNAFGERVASGLYFYTLTAGDFTATRKMLIRK